MSFIKTNHTGVETHAGTTAAKLPLDFERSLWHGLLDEDSNSVLFYFPLAAQEMDISYTCRN